jgi:hypothetical protein
LYLVQRAMLMVAVYYGTELIGVQNTWHALPRVPFLDAWIRWDSFYYLLIAADGYGIQDWGTANSFFPMYPQVIVVFGALMPLPIAALLVSNLAAVLALCFLYAWLKQIEDEKVARRSVEMMILFPTSFFLTAAYSESVYLAAAIGTVLAWSTKRQPLAAGGVLVGCLARPVGVLALGAPFILQWLFTDRRPRNFPYFAAAVLLGAGLTLLIYYSATGNPFAFASAPQVEALGRLSRATDAPPALAVLWDEGWSANLMRRLLNWSAIALSAGAAAHFVRRRRFDLALITMLPLAVPLYFQATLLDAASMGRYALTGFPLFLALARWVPEGAPTRALHFGFQMLQLVLALTFAMAKWGE